LQNKNFRIEIGLVCFVLFIIIVLQYRTIKKNSEVVTQSFGNEQLKGTLIQEKEKYDKMAEENEKILKKLEEVRTNTEKTTTSSNDISEKLKKNDMLLGLTNVKGSGIIIVAKDAKATLATDDINKFLVHDVDLREIINELSNAGAQAIEVNGQRIVSSSCVTCAGNVISINGERVSSPFTIKAIGNADLLYGALTRPGGYIQIMQEQSLISEVKKSNNIQIGKFTGTLPQKYMKTKGE